MEKYICAECAVHESPHEWTEIDDFGDGECYCGAKLVTHEEALRIHAEWNEMLERLKDRGT